MSRLVFLAVTLLFATTLNASDAATTPVKTQTAADKNSALDESRLNSLHQKVVSTFVKENGFGGDRIERFQDFHAIKTASSAGEQWHIAKIDLIGFDKKQPVVFQGRGMPNVAEVNFKRTRPLDAFESAAVKTFLELDAKNDKPECKETQQEIRVVGSLRATANCLKCHSVKEGELLGALSYRLVRAKP